MTLGEVPDLLHALGLRADRLGITDLNEAERTALVPYWAVGIVGMNGFRRLLELQYPLADVAERLRSLGLAEAALAVDRASAKLGPSGSPVDAIDWRRFEPEEDLLFAISVPEMYEAVRRWVDQHRDSFADLAKASSRGRS